MIYFLALLSKADTFYGQGIVIKLDVDFAYLKINRKNSI
jgi:hypothetical protein